MSSGAIPCTVTNAALADYLVMGDNGPGGTLIITNGGSLTPASAANASIIGNNSNALMVVEKRRGGQFWISIMDWLGSWVGRHVDHEWWNGVSCRHVRFGLAGRKRHRADQWRHLESFPVGFLQFNPGCFGVGRFRNGQGK